jgi:hypothetical protein
MVPLGKVKKEMMRENVRKHADEDAQGVLSHGGCHAGKRKLLFVSRHLLRGICLNWRLTGNLSKS